MCVRAPLRNCAWGPSFWLFLDLTTQPFELSTLFRGLQHSLHLEGDLEVISPRISNCMFQRLRFQKKCFKKHLPQVCEWLSHALQSKLLHFRFCYLLCFHIRYYLKPCSSALKKGGGPFTFSIFLRQEKLSPSEIEETHMRLYSSISLWIWWEAQKTYFLNQKIKIQGLSSPSTLMGTTVHNIWN